MIHPQTSASSRSGQEHVHNAYISDYKPSSTTHHEWRDAQNSAAHLIPHLIQLAARKPKLTLLDIGAGSGTITASLAKYMPQGKIVATDISGEILQKAKRHAQDVGVNIIETRQANVYALPFQDGEFDVVHASMVLAHLDDPRSAVREMVRVTKKPSGILSLRESDLHMWSFHPSLPAIYAFNDLLCTVHIANHGHANAGAKLVSWALTAGATRDQIKASAGTWCYSTPDERALWGGTMRDRCDVGGVRSKALEMGIVTESELRGMKEAWEEWMQSEDAWFGCLHGEVIVTL